MIESHRSRLHLHLGGQGADLAPVLLVGRADVEGQQVPQGIDGPIALGAPMAFGAIIPRPRATCGRRLERVTVATSRRGFGFALLRQPPHRRLNRRVFLVPALPTDKGKPEEENTKPSVAHS